MHLCAFRGLWRLLNLKKPRNHNDFGASSWRVALDSHFAPELEGFYRNAETSSSVGHEKILYPEKNAGQNDRSVRKG